MKHKRDINDIYCEDGADAARAFHDASTKFNPRNSKAEGNNQKSNKGNETDANTDRSRAQNGSTSPKYEQLLEAIEVDALLAEPVVERNWHVPDVIPGDDVTMLSSDGAVGKTTLGLQLANATRLGFPWVEHNVKAGPVIYVTAEEPKSELRIRLEHIMAPIARVPEARHNLIFISRATEDCVLARFEKNGIMKPTPLFKAIAALVKEYQANLLILDASADMFGGNELERTQVRNFIGLLRKIAVENRCAVVLLSHPSLEGLRTGRGHSGSTHWHNSVRSRLYLTTPTRKGGDEIDPDLRELTHLKNNRGPRANPIMLRWKKGYFRVEHSGSASDALALAAERKTVLDLVAQYRAEGRPVSVHFAARIISENDAAKEFNRNSIKRAIDALLREKRLWVEKRGPPSRERSYLTTVAPE
jgi:RecA-family ATPase